MQLQLSVAPPGRLPATVLLILGLPLTILGSIQLFDTCRYLAQLQVADGIVTANDLETLPDPEGSHTLEHYYHPVIAFATRDGQALQFTDRIANSPRPFVAGTPVEVYYDPVQPDRASVRSWDRTWKQPLTYLGLGLLPLLTLTLWAIYTRARSAQSQSPPRSPA